MIKYTDYFVPDGRIPIGKIFFDAKTNGKLPPTFSSPEEGIEFFKNMLGLHMIAYGEDLTEEKMLACLISKFINACIIDSTEIDLIISIGDNTGNSKRTPNISHYIQHLYGFVNANVLTFSGNHCANTEFAILFSEAMLKAGIVNHILIINASIYQKNEDRVAGTYGVHGDGAGIIYLSREPHDGIKVIGDYSYTNGILYNSNVDQISTLELYKNYMTCLSGFKSKYEIRPPGISAIIVQNANYMLVNHCLQLLGFDQKKLYLENIGKYGYLGSIDFIVNLHSYSRQSLKKGKCFFSFGTGWAGSHCCLYMKKI